MVQTSSEYRPRTFTDEEIAAEPTVLIEVPFSVLENAAYEMSMTRAYPHAPENYHSISTQKVLKYLDACVTQMESQKVLVVDGGFWPQIHQDGVPFRLPQESRSEG